MTNDFDHRAGERFRAARFDYRRRLWNPLLMFFLSLLLWAAVIAVGVGFLGWH